MERITDVEKAAKIMGDNFIGTAELAKIAHNLPINLRYLLSITLPPVPYSEQQLMQNKDHYLLIWTGIKSLNESALTILKIKDYYGANSAEREPCFYHQDWYLKEIFACEHTLSPGWCLIAKSILESSRAKNPQDPQLIAKDTQTFPSAVMAAFCFFSYYFHSCGELLWANEYLWCSDTDAYGDRIYVGRYQDSLGLNKNGFQIHRHLSIKANYGIAPVII